MLSSENAGVSVVKGSKQTDRCRSIVGHTVARVAVSETVCSPRRTAVVKQESHAPGI